MTISSYNLPCNFSYRNQLMPFVTTLIVIQFVENTLLKPGYPGRKYNIFALPYMKQVFVFLFSLLVLTSCKAYRVFPKEYRHFSSSEKRRSAYVLQPELTTEYSILKEAAIFEFVNDSSSADVVKIKLHPMEKQLAAANGIITTLFTFGQLPALYTDRYFYRFEEISGNTRTFKTFELDVATEVWFWNIFSSKKNFSKQAGQALLANYFRK